MAAYKQKHLAFLFLIVKIIVIEPRFHLLFVSDVRMVYENFVYFILVVFFFFGALLNQIRSSSLLW